MSIFNNRLMMLYTSPSFLAKTYSIRLRAEPRATSVDRGGGSMLKLGERKRLTDGQIVFPRIRGILEKL
jgi:hypothetical protein